MMKLFFPSFPSAWRNLGHGHRLRHVLLLAVILTGFGCEKPRQLAAVTPARDPDLIVGNQYNGTLLRGSADGVVSTYATGLQQPSGMVFGPGNNRKISQVIAFVDSGEHIASDAP